MTTRDENRAAIWGLLATHGDVQWHDRGQDVAFADEVLELAARLGRVETVPALRPVRVATEDERKKHITTFNAALRLKATTSERLGTAENGLTGAVSASEGERARGDGAAAQGSSQGDSGGKR